MASTQAFFQFSESNTCREVGVGRSIDVQFDLDEVLNMSTVDVVGGEFSESNICCSVQVVAEADNMRTVMTTEVDACMVCMEGFESSGGGKQVPCCGHVFHAACISTWLSLSNSCPLCRSKY